MAIILDSPTPERKKLRIGDVAGASSSSSTTAPIPNPNFSGLSSSADDEEDVVTRLDDEHSHGNDGFPGIGSDPEDE